MKPDDELDTFSLGMVTNNKISGLLPLLFTQMNEERQFLYNVTSKVNARQFMSGKMTKINCVRLLSGITGAILACEDYMLDMSVLLIDLNHIYIDVSTGETFLVCLPIVRDTERIDLPAFIKSLLTNMKFSTEESMDYPANIINALNDSPRFTLAQFRKLLSDMNTEEPFNRNVPVRLNYSPTEDTMASLKKQSSVAADEEKQKPLSLKGWLSKLCAKRPNELQVDTASGRRSPLHKWPEADHRFDIPGFIESPFKREAAEHKAKIPMDFGETTTLDDPEPDDGTMLLCAEPSFDPRKQMPYLLRVKTNETIQINTSIFKIGKEKSYVDYFIGDNATISRSHADISKHGDQYFIHDNNSTNHTCINGQMVTANEEALLNENDKIMLGNEAFEFHWL